MIRGNVTLIFLFGVMMLASMTSITMAGRCYSSVSCPASGAPPIRVTLRVENVYGFFQKPIFQHEVTIDHLPQSGLINFLNAAAEAKKEFSYTATYDERGYRIMTLNNLEASDLLGTFWAVYSGNLKWLLCDILSIMPDNNDIITFRYNILE